MPKYYQLIPAMIQLSKLALAYANEEKRPNISGNFLTIRVEYHADDMLVHIYNSYDYKDILKSFGFVFNGQAWVGTPELLSKMPKEIIERMFLSTRKDDLIHLAEHMVQYIQLVK
jgi:hypothetical protein